MLEQIKKFHIVLIKPSKYDDDGYVIRFWKGVLPSNTLNVLHGLTEDIKTRGVFEDLPIEVTTFDETAEKVPMSRCSSVWLAYRQTSSPAPWTWREFSAGTTSR
ncbi:MAG: hypothetical protein E6J73_01120 [Deltaproteobacteria bacterium]|nr:MAG: hypothetical protein E6J73_01120 [Deltaproteobacteria bacterium]